MDAFWARFPHGFGLPTGGLIVVLTYGVVTRTNRGRITDIGVFLLCSGLQIVFDHLVTPIFLMGFDHFFFIQPVC